MKRVLVSFLIVFLTILLSNSFAQDEKKAIKPGWLVFSQNMVKMEEVGKLNTLVDSITAPIMKELIDEGMLIGWGQLNHAWGDEWNVNFYYITESHAAFLKCWNEFVKRANKRFPGSFKDWAPLLKAHKDNMYYVRHMISAPIKK